MDYRRLLIAATEIVLSSDRLADGSPPLDSAELGVSGVLKPHQVEGISWLIRRYELGVNVLLGCRPIQFLILPQLSDLVLTALFLLLAGDEVGRYVLPEA